MESERERERGGDRKRLSRFSRLCQRKKRTRISGGEKERERERDVGGGQNRSLSPPLLLPDLASSFNCENKDPGCPFCSPRERRATGSMHLHPCAAPLRSSSPSSPFTSGWLACACLPAPRSFLACHLCSDGFV